MSTCSAGAAFTRSGTSIPRAHERWNSHPSARKQYSADGHIQSNGWRMSDVRNSSWSSLSILPALRLLQLSALRIRNPWLQSNSRTPYPRRSTTCASKGKASRCLQTLHFLRDALGRADDSIQCNRQSECPANCPVRLTGQQNLKCGYEIMSIIALHHISLQAAPPHHTQPPSSATTREDRNTFADRPEWLGALSARSRSVVLLPSPSLAIHVTPTPHLTAFLRESPRTQDHIRRWSSMARSIVGVV